MRFLIETYQDTYQVMSDGCVEIILDSSADVWDGTSLKPMCDEVHFDAINLPALCNSFTSLKKRFMTFISLP
jgi:hypothetical protein